MFFYSVWSMEGECLFWEISKESSRNDRGLNSSISSVQSLKKNGIVSFTGQKKEIKIFKKLKAGAKKEVTKLHVGW